MRGLVLSLALTAVMRPLWRAAVPEQALWKQFLRSLVARGLAGVQLVVSDAHLGLKNAVAEAMHGTVFIRLVGAVLAEQHDEWQVARR